VRGGVAVVFVVVFVVALAQILQLVLALSRDYLG
jgi:hypothetical protein